jgi:hypothetical protein
MSNAELGDDDTSGDGYLIRTLMETYASTDVRGYGSRLRQLRRDFLYCIAPWSCACGSRCESGETDCPNCSTIACRMAAAQFFSVFLRCEAEQSPDEALVRE